MNDKRPKLYLRIGDKVRLLKNTYMEVDISREDSYIVTGIEGNIGIVVSADEWVAYEESILHKSLSEAYLLNARRGMENGTVYPIKFGETTSSTLSSDISTQCYISIELIETFRYRYDYDLRKGYYEQILEKIE